MPECTQAALYAVCTACEAGDHEGSWITEGLMRCGCPCHELIGERKAIIPELGKGEEKGNIHSIESGDRTDVQRTVRRPHGC